MCAFQKKTLKIVSGGQTGVDRTALDCAIAFGLDHGGWCPRGRIAADGVIAEKYRLRETESDSYPERTYRNIRDSDATLIFAESLPLTGGTLLTAFLTAEKEKPSLTILADLPVREAVEKTRVFLARESVKTLNIAGPRASVETSRLLSFVREVLGRLFDDQDASEL